MTPNYQDTLCVCWGCNMEENERKGTAENCYFRGGTAFLFSL